MDISAFISCAAAPEKMAIRTAGLAWYGPKPIRQAACRIRIGNSRFNQGQRIRYFSDGFFSEDFTFNKNLTKGEIDTDNDGYRFEFPKDTAMI